MGVKTSATTRCAFTLSVHPIWHNSKPQISIGRADKAQLNTVLDPNVSLLDLKRPITRKELAAWLDVDIRTIDTAVLRGGLKQRKLGHIVRFMPEDIRVWLEGK